MRTFNAICAATPSDLLHLVVFNVARLLAVWVWVAGEGGLGCARPYGSAALSFNHICVHLCR